MEQNTEVSERDAIWNNWETWFREIRASHTLAPEVVYTPASFPGQSWVACAGAILDAVALYSTAIDNRLAAAARLCLEEGIDMISDVSATIGYDPAKMAGPLPELSQSEYSNMLATLAAEGVGLAESSEGAWESFAAIRAQYLRPLIYLAERTQTKDYLVLMGSAQEMAG